MLNTYSFMKLGIIMFLVPWPGVPGKWFWLNLNSPLSNAIQDNRAACSGAVGMEKLVNPSRIGFRAASAVAHSEGKAALAQDEAVGTTERSWGKVKGFWQ